MGGGGLLQIVAKGVQDIYLTYAPQITYWKIVYRRYTDFAIECMEQTFQNQTAFGRRLTCCIQRNADLISGGYFVFCLPAIEADTSAGATQVHWVNSIGHAIINQIQITIGGQCIDTQYGEWMEVWEELTNTFELTFAELVGKRYTVAQLVDDAKNEIIYYTPLQFWWCRNPGLALPLISLQYHDVKIEVETRPLQQLWCSLGNGNATPLIRGQGRAISDGDLRASLYINYVYLDGEERARFAQSSHEYLITQVQTTGACPAVGGSSQSTHKFQLNFNHPVKELIWTVEQQCHRDNKVFFNYEGRDGQDPVVQVDLQLNGHPRFQTREGKYFRTVLPYEVHTRIPEKHIYIYPFCLDAERAQPNGSANFSRIDNAFLNLSLQQALGEVLVTVWAINYNVLRIMAGMGGVAYSN